jgi:RNA polymerase sigma-70 factor, ECF subfamily
MEPTELSGDWRGWYREYGPRLLVYARHWTSRQADAEDAVQDGFLRFWRRGDWQRPDPAPLLFAAVRSASLDRWRRDSRRERREQIAAADFEPLLEPSFGVEEERRAMIERALQKLSCEQRETLSLKIWGDLSFEQIGRALNISPNTAASRYRYALEALRKQLSADVLA